MKILGTDPNLDYYYSLGNREELKVSRGNLRFFPKFNNPTYSQDTSLLLAINMGFRSEYFYSPVSIFAEITIDYFSPEPGVEDVNFFLTLKDDDDDNPRIFARFPYTTGIHRVKFSNETREKNPVRGNVPLTVNASLPSSSIHFPLLVSQMYIERFKLFVNWPIGDLAITSAREAGFYNTSQYIYTSNGRRVKGLAGYKYRTLEVEIAKTSHDEFQSFITNLHNRGVGNPLWLQFDECDSETYKDFNNFKCTLENLEEIMLQGSTRRDFYKTKLRFREYM